MDFTETLSLAVSGNLLDGLWLSSLISALDPKDLPF